MDRILSKDEMNALLNTPGGEGKALEAGKVSAYNFRRPERFPKAALRAIQLVHDRFCTSAAASLSGYFRVPAEMRVVSMDQANLGEFLNSLPQQTCLTSMSMRPLQGTTILELELDVAFPLIDRLLGGNGGQPSDATRKITDIESNIIRGVINLIAADLTEAWRGVSPVEFHVQSSETRPQFLNAGSPGEVVLTISFELKIAETAGTMRVCFPFSALQPVLAAFDEKSSSERRESNSDLLPVLRRVLQAPITVSCDLPPTMVTVSDLVNVSAGDIMRLDGKIDEFVRIIVGGIPSFEGSLMDIEGTKAVGIAGRIAG